MFAASAITLKIMMNFRDYTKCILGSRSEIYQLGVGDCLILDFILRFSTDFREETTLFMILYLFEGSFRHAETVAQPLAEGLLLFGETGGVKYLLCSFKV